VMLTRFEKARGRLHQKIRKVSNNALPDLLAVGTDGRAAPGRLDGVINGLEQRLCKALKKGYPKMLAAAVIEKRRSRQSDIVAAEKVTAERGAPNPIMKTDLEQSTAPDDAEPMTDAKSAAKARKKAIKANLKAEQAEAAAAEARAELNKGSDMDTMVAVAKSVIVGKPSGLTKRDFFLELWKRADQTRQPGETRERAFTRYATTVPDGRLLMQAHKAASGEDYSGEPEDTDDEPTTNEGYQRLMDLAAEKRKKGETVEQAFARLYADPKYRDLVATEKRMHQARVAKAIGFG